MKAIVKIEYKNCEIESFLIAIRIVHEIFTNKGNENVTMPKSIDIPDFVQIDFEYESLVKSYDFIRFALNKLKELKALAPGVTIKISHFFNYSITYIKGIVSYYYNIDVKKLDLPTRKREIVQTRQVAMYFSKNFTNNSLATIGSQIGDKDHATVLHAIKTVNNLCETDKRFAAQIQEIENQLKK